MIEIYKDEDVERVVCDICNQNLMIVADKEDKLYAFCDPCGCGYLIEESYLLPRKSYDRK